MPFCKIEFFDHVAELYNKKVHSHPYHIHPALGHMSQPHTLEYISLKILVQ